MKKISIITQHDMNTPNGSTIRPKWQFEALKKNNFNDVELIDNFNETKLNNISDTLIHAHQFSGKWIKNQKYFVDIHGLEHIQSLNFKWISNLFVEKICIYCKIILLQKI